MRILLVSAVPPPEGGIASWTLKYISYCKKHEIDVKLVNIALTGKRGKQINTKRSIIDEIRRTMYIITEFKRNIVNEKVEIVHINSSCSHFGIYRDYLCVKIAQHRNIPVIFHCHCNIKDQILNSKGKKVLKKICNIAAEVLVLNMNSQEYVSSLTDIKPIIVPNFIEKELVVDNHKINEKINKIVFVGHVQKTKGAFEILEVARQLKDIDFVLIGPVSNEIKKEELPQNYILKGSKPQSSIPQYLREADVFLFPSYTEGFSLSLTEAMAFGVPCIATNVGANSDMLEDKGGIIVPIKDSNAIISAINVLNDVELRNIASKWNIEKVKNNYMIDTVMGLMVSVYKKVTKDDL